MFDRDAVQIRSAAMADIDIVRAIVRAAYAKWVPVIGREPMPMKADYERALREHALDLLQADGQPVALIEMIMRPDHLFIENVAVTPTRQGQGFGRHLLAHAERKARAAGLPAVHLQTNAAFEANVRLYQAFGYRIDREEPFMGGTSVYMSKVISEGWS
ncbi:MAG: GNAT family N-acetyltransferase [Acetobacteraceae bacterium]